MAITINLPPLPTLHIRKQQLEPVTQRPHIRVHIPLQLKSLRHHLDSPMLHLCVLARFEAQQKVAGVLGVDAEVVDGTFRVGLGVGCQPVL